MKRPVVARTLMVLFTLALGATAAVLFDGLQRAFLANPALNTTIIAIFTVGVISAFLQMARLSAAIEWVAHYRATHERTPKVPSLLAPLSLLFQQKEGEGTVPQSYLRTMLESVYGRIDDGRELARYLMNTLILLGLLGTFWGLLDTVGGIGSVLGGLNVGDGDIQVVFDNFKEGLKKPLLGMGISFSASLFGLASSLVLGFFDVTVGRVQSRFCEELEDWFTTLGSEIPENGTFSSRVAMSPRYQEAHLENLAEHLEKLQRIFKQQEASREAERVSVRMLAEGVSALDDHLKAQKTLMVKLTELQQQIAPVLTHIGAHIGDPKRETIEEHTRRIDLNLKEIGEKVSESADTLASELRDELKIIAKLLASNEVRTNA
jgi:hypothetical protein